MQANIYIRNKDDPGRFLCQLDLMKFTEEQVRQRMEERGIRDDAFFIYGFSDWSVDTQMSLQDAYLLKRAIEELYDGDDYLVKFMLTKRYSPREIISRYYRYLGTDEEDIMYQLIKSCDLRDVVRYWKASVTFVNALSNYVNQKEILLTPKGFYGSVDRFGWK